MEENPIHAGPAGPPTPETPVCTFTFPKAAVLSPQYLHCGVLFYMIGIVIS